MFFTAARLELQNFLLSLLSYILVISTGILIANLLLYLPSIETALAAYTSLSLESILPVLMVLIKIIKG